MNFRCVVGLSRQAESQELERKNLETEARTRHPIQRRD
jgi:hypothetical protein